MPGSGGPPMHVVNVNESRGLVALPTQLGEEARPALAMGDSAMARSAD